jgi:hypothetical protein
MIRTTLLSALALTIPVLGFAGGQPARVRMSTKAEMADHTGIARAIQQGKGTGMSPSQKVIRADAYRVQTREDSLPVDPPAASGPNWGDSAFRK